MVSITTRIWNSSTSNLLKLSLKPWFLQTWVFITVYELSICRHSFFFIIFEDHAKASFDFHIHASINITLDPSTIRKFPFCMRVVLVVFHPIELLFLLGSISLQVLIDLRYLCNLSFSFIYYVESITLIISYHIIPFYVRVIMFVDDSPIVVRVVLVFIFVLVITGYVIYVLISTFAYNLIVYLVSNNLWLLIFLSWLSLLIWRPFSLVIVSSSFWGFLYSMSCMSTWR